MAGRDEPNPREAVARWLFNRMWPDDSWSEEADDVDDRAGWLAEADGVLSALTQAGCPPVALESLHEQRWVTVGGPGSLRVDIDAGARFNIASGPAKRLAAELLDAVRVADGSRPA